MKRCSMGSPNASSLLSPPRLPLWNPLLPPFAQLQMLFLPKAQTHITSFAGRAFAWGMGTNHQLGTGEEEDVWSPVEMTGKQLENRLVLAVSSGGQHTVLLVKDKARS